MGKGIKVGLALGSGGARGLAHAGVLHVLEAEGLMPDVIAGTSMGAIVGGLYAEEPDAASTWTRLQAYVNDEDFAESWSSFVPKESGGEDEQQSSRFQDMLDFVQRKMVQVKTVTRPYQQDSDRLRKPLENLFSSRTFEELALPFAAVGVDLISGRSVAASSGDLIDGLYGSCAIPAIFPALERDDRYIIDGGGPYRVPIEACRALGADVVIAVSIPAFEELKFSTGLDLILRSNTIARDRLARFALTTADLVIHPSVDDFHWADFRAGPECRDRGVAAAEAVMPRLRSLLARRRSWSFRLRGALARRLGLSCESRYIDVD